MRQTLRFVIAGPLFILVGLTGCGKKTPAPTPEVVAIAAATLPTDPSDPVWRSVPEHVAKLILQDLVEPRLMIPSTSEVRIRAMQNGASIAFRLEWLDSTKSDMATPSGFCDACAIQLPRRVEPNVPAPQMGETGKGVEITYWNAGWQAVVDGRGDSLNDIYPNAVVDHYPFEATPLRDNPEAHREMAARYSPARALNNLMAGPRTNPVQDLIAEGPGTITPAPAASSRGKGQHSATGWTVVITRSLPGDLAPAMRSQVAFAVWQGSQEEVGARKMRTGWVPILRGAAR